MVDKAKTKGIQIISGGYLKPVVLQLFGLALMIAFVVNYFVGGNVSALLVGASLALIGLGSASGALITVRQEIQTDSEQYKEHLKRISDTGNETIQAGDSE